MLWIMVIYAEYPYQFPRSTHALLLLVELLLWRTELRCRYTEGIGRLIPLKYLSYGNVGKGDMVSRTFNSSTEVLPPLVSASKSIICLLIIHRSSWENRYEHNETDQNPIFGAITGRAASTSL